MAKKKTGNTFLGTQTNKSYSSQAKKRKEEVTKKASSSSNVGKKNNTNKANNTKKTTNTQKTTNTRAVSQANNVSTRLSDKYGNNNRTNNQKAQTKNNTARTNLKAQDRQSELDNKTKLKSGQLPNSTKSTSRLDTTIKKNKETDTSKYESTTTRLEEKYGNNNRTKRTASKPDESVVKDTNSRLEKKYGGELKKASTKRTAEVESAESITDRLEKKYSGETEQNKFDQLTSGAIQQVVGGYMKALGDVTNEVDLQRERLKAKHDSGEISDKVYEKELDALNKSGKAKMYDENKKLAENKTGLRGKVMGTMDDFAEWLTEKGTKLNVKGNTNVTMDASSTDKNGEPIYSNFERVAGSAWVSAIGMASDMALGPAWMAGMLTRTYGNELGTKETIDDEGNVWVSKDQDRKNASLQALKEVGTEAMFAGLKAPSALFGKNKATGFAERALDSAVNKISNKTARNVTYTIGKRILAAGEEGTEEVVAGLLDPVIANATYANELAEKTGKEEYRQSVSAADIVEAVASAGLMTAVLGIPGTINAVANKGKASEVAEKTYGEEAKKKNISTEQALAQAAMGVDDEVMATRASAMNDRLSKGGNALADEQVMELVDALVPQASKVQGEVLTARAVAYNQAVKEGNVITPYSLAPNEKGELTFLEGPTNDTYQASLKRATRKGREVAKAFPLEQRKETAKTIAAIDVGLGSIGDVQSFYVNMPEARAIYNETHKKAQLPVVKYRDGSVNPTATNVATREFLMTTMIENYKTKAAEETVKHVDEQSGVINNELTRNMGAEGRAKYEELSGELSVFKGGEYLLATSAFQDAYRAGKANVSFEELKKEDNPIHKVLSDKMLEEAYISGVADEKAVTDKYIKQGEKISQIKDLGHSKGIIDTNTYMTDQTLLPESDREFYSKLAAEFGVSFVFHDGTKENDPMARIVKDEKGKPVKDENGKNKLVKDKEGESLLENGFYVNGVIHLNARVKAYNTAMQLTYKHELTHHVARYAPAEYKVLVDLVKKSYAEKYGVDALDQMIAKVMKDYQQAGIEGEFTEEDALEEIVADVARNLDDKVFIKEAEQNVSFAQKIINAIRNILSKIRIILARERTTRDQNKSLLEALDIMKEFEEKYVAALGKAYENRGKIGLVSGRDKYSMAGNGYDGYSMSNNARDAYAHGEKPLSRWTKADVMSEVEESRPDLVDVLKKIPLNTLKNELLYKSSWHHTSSMYNRTNFYSIDESKLESLTEENIANWDTSKPVQDVVKYKGKIEYIEWTGSKNHPKANEKVLDNVNIEERGSFYYVTDDSGNEILKKKIGSNGTRVTDYEAEQRRKEEERQKLEEYALNSSEEAMAFLSVLEEEGFQRSTSGHIYPRGRKPSPADYNNLSEFFRVGEQRLVDNWASNSYTLETWNGSEWVAEDKKYSIVSAELDDGTMLKNAILLDSPFFNGLNDAERVELFKLYVDELSGKEFDFVDKNGDKIKLTIPASDKFKNKNGKKISANNDLKKKFSKDKIKQEAVALLEEVLSVAEYKDSRASKYGHGWIDDYGNNDWDYYNAYLIDKNNNVWEAILNIATTDKGKELIYDIKKATDSRTVVQMYHTLPTSVANNNVAQTSDIVKRYSPVTSEEDQAYMDAVNRKDYATAQRMVDEVAEKALANSKIRTSDGRLMEMYQGTVQGGYTILDKSKAHVGGNSGAGFYYTNVEDDAIENYKNIEGADNFFKAQALAETLYNEASEPDYDGPIKTYDDALAKAKKQLNANPQLYNVYLNSTKPYYRDFRNSTNLWDDLEISDEDAIALSGIEREDCDDEEEFEDAIREYIDNQIYKTLYGNVWTAYRQLEDNYEVFEGMGTLDDLVSDMLMHAYDYQSLTWDDILSSVQHTFGAVEVIRDDWTELGEASTEFTRAIIEAFGYDSIFDKEVSKKFNQMKALGTDRDAAHVIIFNPEQAKSREPVTYDDEGNVIPLSERFNTKNRDIRYSVVSDSETIEFLENQEHITTYRAMVAIDGQLYPPMSTGTVADGLRPSEFIGSWTQSEINTNPKNFTKDGKFKLKKDNGNIVPARYNPYIHSSLTMLNDQFSTAYKRPNMVVVEGEIPVSELTSGYRAEHLLDDGTPIKAKDTTGKIEWKAGKVQAKLSGRRTVYLSRWFKPTRIVPNSEVADSIAKMIEGEDVKIPDNVVTPSLLKELEKRNVPVEYTLTAKEKSALDNLGASITNGGTAAKYSLTSWNDTDIDALSELLVKAGFEKKEVDGWIENVNSVASLIADDMGRLNYAADQYQKALKDNDEYLFTLDLSTLCQKRRLYQGTYNAIMKRIVNKGLHPEDTIHLRKLMDDLGYETPCGICYEESRKKNEGKFAEIWLNGVSDKEWAAKWKEYEMKVNKYKNGKLKNEPKKPERWMGYANIKHEDSYIPTIDDVTTTDGREMLREKHPEALESYLDWQKGRGSANPKVSFTHTDYRGDILKLTKGQIARLKHIGGLRIQSFSDFETVHIIDMMQAVMDMSAMNLTSQAYTKVPAFADIFGGTGIKINLSLIGQVKDGVLTFDAKEGIDPDEAFRIRDKYSDNVGTILVGANIESILAAWADDRIDMVIPFHRSGWGLAEFEELGLIGYDDFQDYQAERYLDGSPNGQSLSAAKKKAIYSEDYWDYSKTGKENAEAYLKLCAEKRYRPVFYNFLHDNGDGTWSLQEDGSTDGYWKSLIDFKMYNNEGKGVPQQEVKPIFDMEVAQATMDAYEGNADTLPVAEDVVDMFVDWFNNKETKYSRISVEEDVNYMNAVVNGDMETAQRMVDEVAQRKGLVHTYHGTEGFGFTKIDFTKSDDGISFFSTDNVKVARSYSRTSGVRGLSEKRGENPNYEDEVEEAKQVLRESCQDYADALSRLAEIRGWIDAKTIDDTIEMCISFGQDVYEALVDFAAEAFYATHEIRTGMEFADYQNSEEATKILDMIEVVTQDAESYIEIAYVGGDMESQGNMSLYIDTTNFLHVNANGENWNNLSYEYKGWTYHKTREVALHAKEQGYDGVWFENVYDTGTYGNSATPPSNVYISFNEKSIKSADPVTYDDEGNVIPLSERFDPENEDIRWSRVDAVGNTLTEAQERFFSESKARNEDGLLVPVYHTTSRGGFTKFDPKFSDDNRSLFFASSEAVSRTYASGIATDINEVLTGNAKNCIIESLVVTDAKRKGGGFRWTISGKFFDGERYEPFEKHGKDEDGDAYSHSTDFPNLVATIHEYVGKVDPSAIFSAYFDAWEHKHGVWEPVDMSGKNLVGHGLGFGGVGTTNIYPCYLNLKNPLIVDAKGAHWYEILVNIVDPDGPEGDAFAYIPPDASVIIEDLRASYYGEKETDEGDIYCNGTLRLAGKKKNENSEWEEFSITKKASGEMGSVFEGLVDSLSEELGIGTDWDDNDMLFFENDRDIHKSVLFVYGKDGKQIDEYNEYNKGGYVLAQEMRTREIAFLADKLGRDGVIVKNCYDVGDKQNIIGEGLSDIYIAFNSEQVKLISNKNPTEDPDIRFSKADIQSTTEWVEDMMNAADETFETEDDALNQLRQNRADFLNEVRAQAEAIAKNPTKLTKGTILDEKKVGRDVQKLLEYAMQNSMYRGKYKHNVKKDVIAALKVMYKQMADEDWAGAGDTVTNISSYIVDSIELTNDIDFDNARDLQHYMRNARLRVGDDLKSDIDWNYFRRKNFGRIGFDQNGVTVDTIWEDIKPYLRVLIGKEVEDIDHQADMLLAIDMALDATRPVTVVRSSEETTQLMSEVASDLWDICYEADSWKSFADKKKAEYDERTKKLKERQKEAIRELRNEKNEIIKELKKENDSLQSYLRKQTRKTDRAIEALEDYKQKVKDSKEKKKIFQERSKRYKSIEKNYARLAKMLLEPDTKQMKLIPEQFRQSVAEILVRLDFQTDRSKKLEAKYGRVSQAQQKQRSLKETIREIAESGESYDIFSDNVYNEYIVNLADYVEKFLDNLDSSDVYGYDTEALDHLNDLMATLVHSFNNYNQTFADEKRRKIGDIGNKIQEEAVESVKLNGKRKTYGGLRGAVDSLTAESMETPIDFFENMGEAWTDVYLELRRGLNKHTLNMNDLRIYFEKVFRDYFNKKGPGSSIENWREDYKEYTLKDGNVITLTPAHIMSLYCHSRREQSMGHILVGGVTVSDIKQKSNAISHILGAEISTQSQSTMITQADIDMLIGTLSEEQKKIADKLQALLNNEVQKWGNDTSMQLYGIRLFREDSYFPIAVSRLEIDSKVDDAVPEPAEKIRNFGFTKPLKPHAGQALVLDDIFSVVCDHCNKMSLYNAYSAAIADFQRVFNYREKNDEGMITVNVKGATSNAYGQQAISYIMKLMADINGSTATYKTGAEQVMDTMLANYKKAAIGFNPRVAVQQPMSIIRALMVLDIKWFRKGGLATPKDRKRMLAHCPIAMWKSWGNYQNDYARNLEDIMFNRDWSKLDAITMAPYGLLDDMTWACIYKAIEAETKENHPEVAFESEEYWKIVNDRMDYVIDHTQVVDSVFHRSAIMRSKDRLSKLFSSFMAEPTRTWNMLRSAIVQSKKLNAKGEKGQAVQLLSKGLAVYTLSAFGTSLAAAIIDMFRDDDDDQTWLQKFFEHLWDNFIDNVNPLNMLFLVKDFSNIAQNIIEGNYFSSSNMITDGVKKSVQAIADIIKKANGTSDKSIWDIAYETADGLGSLSGIPAKNAMRVFENVTRILIPESSAEDGSDDEALVTKFLGNIGLGNSGSSESNGISVKSLVAQAEKASKGKKGSAKRDALWDAVNDGYTNDITEGNMSNIDKRRKAYVQAGGSKEDFDERISSRLKTEYKKCIGDVDDLEKLQKINAELTKCGYDDEDISEIARGSNVAQKCKAAMMLRDDDEVKKWIWYLAEAGLTQEDLDYLWEKRATGTSEVKTKYLKKLVGKSSNGYIWPTTGTISSGFGYRTAPIAGASTYHEGIDIAASRGTTVSSAKDGTVISAGYVSGFGYQVVVDHGDGDVTYYSHLYSYNVLPGDYVSQGQKIGGVGSTGNSTGNHLDFRVQRSGEYIDPLTLLN